MADRVLTNVNFYETLPREYLKPLADYPNHKYLNLDLPIRAVIAGSSGSGKTNCVYNFIRAFDCFDKIYLFVPDPSEPLYRYLIDRIKELFGEDRIEIFDDITEVPDVLDFDPDINNLVIIDDMINERGNNCREALNLFTKGRRYNISILYVTQDFFKLNPTVRKNCKVICLTRFNDPLDLENVLRKYKQQMSSQDIRALYNYATQGGIEHCFTIDCEGRPEDRYRRDFMPIGSQVMRHIDEGLE